MNPNNHVDGECYKVSSCIVFRSGKLLRMGRPLEMDSLEWDGGDFSFYDNRLNLGVGGIMVGFPINRKFIGNVV